MAGGFIPAFCCNKPCPACNKKFMGGLPVSASRAVPGSDIDLLALVRRAGDKKAVLAFFSGRAAAILERYRFPLAPVVLTVDEFRALYRAKDDFARTILKTGSIVKGKLLAEIL